MESTQLGLEAVVGSIFDGSDESLSSNPEIKFQLHTIFAGCYIYHC